MFARFTKPAPAAPARAPDGRRIYAIGDIHGRADLLEALLATIARDSVGAERPIIVFLGDYVDRGADSRRVIDLLLTLDAARFELRFLRGNHEAAMLEFLHSPDAGRRWMRIGGDQALRSYGVAAPSDAASDEAFKAASVALAAALPPEHLAFLQRLELSVQYGDYLFVHAGLRPGRDLAVQTEEDMLTIRKPFLQSKERWPFVVVHGHSPVDSAFSDGRRIGVDTAAYATGRLTAVRLEGESVGFLTT